MKNHWTPRYLLNRVSVYFYEKNNPSLPWLTQSANQFLSSYLKKTDIMLEFGSGRSSLWFSQNVQSLHSVEHDEHWFNKTQWLFNEQPIRNIKYHFIKDPTIETNYIDTLASSPNHYFDVILVDGIHRAACTELSISKLKPGGLLIIDNVERYLSSDSYSPEAHKSVNQSERWSSIETQLKQWRFYWTTSGVTDTAFFFKPYAVSA